MDFGDPRQRAAFFAIHCDLPREGPGNRPSLLRALELVGALGEAPKVLDIGCGPGQQTIELARQLPEASITAIDLHQPFLDSLRDSASAAGVSAKIDTLNADMGDLASHFEESTIDLIWSEGAAYNLGLERALREWQPLLSPRGRIALTEPVYLSDDPPDSVTEMFEDYPGMQSIPVCRDLVSRSGYHLLGDFVLPHEAWTQSYYAPLAERLDLLEARFEPGSPEHGVLQEHRQEIANYERHSEHYGYCFLVMRVSRR